MYTGKEKYFVIFGVTAVIIAIIVYSRMSKKILLVRSNKHREDNVAPLDVVKITNLLPYHTIEMSIPSNKISYIAVFSIKPGETVDVDRETLDESPEEIRIFIKNNGRNIRYSTYSYWLNTEVAPQRVYIGQVTSDNIIVGEPIRVTSQGLPGVNIHNFTDVPLILNNCILVKPRGLTRYRGKYAYGVPLGTILKDTSEIPIYQDFMLERVVTDIYYGVISNDQLLSIYND